MRRTAKEFFDAVRYASQDAERCRTQLEALEKNAAFGGSAGMGERVSGDSGNRVERRVVSYVGQGERLEQRRARDFAFIDRACVVLYGPDQQGGGGLCKASPKMAGVWADVLWWRYCAAESWDAVANAVGYTARPCQEFNGRALAWIDRNRFMSAIIDSDDLY